MPDEFDEKIEPDAVLDDPGVVRVADHLEKSATDQCGYCGQHFGPDDIFVVKEVYGRTWHFCSEECYRDFLDASDFKDQDLDGYQDDVNVKFEYDPTEGGTE